MKKNNNILELLTQLLHLLGKGTLMESKHFPNQEVFFSLQS